MRNVTVKVPQFNFRGIVVVVLFALSSAVAYLFMEISTHERVLVSHQAGLISHKQYLDVVVTEPNIKAWFTKKINEEMAKRAKKG